MVRMAPKAPRNSPSESATKFAIGTNKTGNDGNKYVVVATAAGVQRWAKATSAPKGSKSLIDSISWRTTDPVSDAHAGYVSGTDDTIPVPPEAWKTKLAVRKGDTVALAWDYDGREPAIVAPVKGTTLLDMFKSIEAGMRAPIKVDQFAKAYKLIGDSRLARPQPPGGRSKRTTKRTRWSPMSTVADLVRKLELRQLTPYELIRDGYDFWEGNLKRERSGVWTYGLGS